jgi:hypothetical protein
MNPPAPNRVMSAPVDHQTYALRVYRRGLALDTLRGTTRTAPGSARRWISSNESEERGCRMIVVVPACRSG